jgi:RHS repeat-associated protein
MSLSASPLSNRPARYGHHFLQLLLLLISPLLAITANAQDPTLTQGIKPYGAYHGGDIDVVSFDNGKLDLHIPLLSYPQRGKLQMSFTVRYNNPGYSLYQTCILKNPCTYSVLSNFTTPQLPWGVSVVPDFSALSLIPTSIYNNVTKGYPLLYLPDGSSHTTGNLTGTSSYRATDASGWMVNSSATDFYPGTVIAPDGTQYLFNTKSYLSSEEDTNGNEITTNFSNSVPTGWTDSLGRVVPIPPTQAGGVAGSISTCPAGALTVTTAYAWNVPNPSGATATYTFCYGNLSVDVLVGNFYGTTPYKATPLMLQSIVLPNGQSYSFTYDGAADLTEITLPTGGTISYSPSIGQTCVVGGPFPQNYFSSVYQRTINANDGTGAHTWSYSPTGGVEGATKTVTVTDPVGNQEVHTMTGLNGSCRYYETTAQKYQGTSSSGTLLQTVATNYSFNQDPYTVTEPVYSSSVVNVVPTTITTTWPNGKTKKVTKSYDSGFSYYDAGSPGLYGKVVSESEYDYGAGASGGLLKTTTNAYEFQSNSSYQTANLINLPASIKIANGSSYSCAETDYVYDTSSRLFTSGISTQHVSAPNSVRGNLSATTRQISGKPCQSATSWTSSITAYENAYDTGEIYQSIDPLGNTTTYTYSSTFAGAYVTETQAPSSNSPTLAQHITYDSYDFNTGLKTSHTDENSNPTTYAYDEMWRVKTITPPAPEGAVTITYTDTPGSVSVEKQQIISGSSSTTQYDLIDGLGRKVSHVVANGQATPYDKTDTCFEGRGLKSFVSYPYQTSTWNAWPACPISQPGDSYSYDGLKRTASVTHSDSTAITYSYTGAATSTSDEGNGTRGVQKVSQVDGLGRLISACEVTSTTLSVGTDHTPVACGQDIAATGFLTTYAYDGLNDLTSVSQGSSLNPRTFTYDSLSRLITTTNPEAGTTCFGTWSGSICNENYDADSNVLSRTRPAPNQSSSTTYVTATYAYDTLNRLRTKTYSDGTTPTVTLDYDESSVGAYTLTNTIGRPSSEYTGPSTAVTSHSILSYNAPGWTVQDIQCTPQNCANGTYLTFNYGYDGVGDVTSSGNGIIFMYALQYSVAPRLTQITTNWFSPTVDSGMVISGVQYNAFGEPSSATLNDSVIAESWAYDARGRLQSDVSVASSTTLYSLTNLTHSGNGDVLTATDNINGTWSNYSYDDFNRLISSTCSAACPQGAPSVAFSYTYDRYGNRWQQTLTEGEGSWPQPSYSFNANNQISASDGLVFDAAGNIINDTIHTYTYDAENRIVQVDAGSTAVYAYDAEGRRVAKTAATAGGAFEYLFDLQGRAVTEMGAGTKNVNRSEVYGAGRHLATQNVGLVTTYFTHNDWLGTERVRSSLSGTVAETCQSLPYGDVLNCSGAQASTLHFTGQMRDAETNLTEFPARYYSPAQGRWYSPDWASAQVPVPYADLHNPQSLNLYDYVGGDPTNHADADGHSLYMSESSYAEELSDSKDEEQTEGQADAQKAQGQNQSNSTTPPPPPTPDPAGTRTDPKLNPQPNDSSTTSSSSSTRTPAKGPPDTTVDVGGGTDRKYGPDGRAVKDVDSGHDHGAGDPHAHDWDWSGAKPQRGPGRPLTPEEQKQIDAAKKALIIYFIVSEGSRILFPPRNLVPVP